MARFYVSPDPLDQLDLAIASARPELGAAAPRGSQSARTRKRDKARAFSAGHADAMDRYRAAPAAVKRRRAAVLAKYGA